MGNQVRQNIPRVSILVPAYNGAATLGATITGALTQTYPDVEVVVVDDGSQDETSAIATAFGERVVVVRQDNHGLAHARNTALASATGDFVLLCDSDDYLLPNAVAESLAVYRRSRQRSIVTNEAYLLTSNGLSHGRRLLRGTVPPARRQRSAILERNFVGILSLIPVTLFDEVGTFDRELRMLEDWDLWLRAIFAGWTIAVQRVPVALYRLTAGSLSTSVDIFDVEERILRQFEDRSRSQLSEDERRYLERRRHLGSPMEVRQRAATALRRGDLSEARALYRKLALLSDNNPRVKARASLISCLPGAAAAFAVRQRLTDQRLGARVASRTPGIERR